MPTTIGGQIGLIGGFVGGQVGLIGGFVGGHTGSIGLKPAIIGFATSRPPPTLAASSSDKFSTNPRRVTALLIASSIKSLISN
jgi:hypothetical protein